MKPRSEKREPLNRRFGRKMIRPSLVTWLLYPRSSRVLRFAMPFRRASKALYDLAASFIVLAVLFEPAPTAFKTKLGLNCGSNWARTSKTQILDQFSDTFLKR